MEQKPCVLIVEDDRDLREIEGFLLQSEGYTTHLAENGQVALEILANLHPNQVPGCILLDIMMPVMDGLAFARVLLRDHPSDWARIPIIVNSANGSAVSQLLRLPLVVEAISKPMEVTQLLGAVRKHCGPGIRE